MLSTTSDVHSLAVEYVAQYTHGTCLRLIEAIKYPKKSVEERKGGCEFDR
jgi:hypothetical protein